MNVQQNGKIGEDAAVKYLKKHRYKILTRNYRKRFGEIDIVAEKEGRLVFVEVKTRSSVAYGTPAEYVTYKKQQRIIQCAMSYLQEQDSFDVAISFDVIEVLLKNGKVSELNHIENAFST